MERVIRCSFCFMSFVLMSLTAFGQERVITKVSDCSLPVAEGNAPQLPYQMWVEYADGKGEYRQVRWINSSLDLEKELADATRHPAGSAYDVRGFIVGDNTTSNGYPVTAHVKVEAAATTKDAAHCVA